jgi:hypothetical protein
MNAEDVLKYGHRTVLKTLDGVAESDWDTPGVCGVWSVKEIVAHLASHELVLVDILRSFLGVESTPNLDRYLSRGGQFNDEEVANRGALSAAETQQEYERAHAQSRDLLARIPVETRRQSGALPWYGPEYDLEDYIAYGNYGHKREHCAQINVYRDRLDQRGPALEGWEAAGR